MKEVPITYNGTPATISILEMSEIKAGVVAKIMKLSIKKIPGYPLPDLEYDAYMIALATNMIKKAPWPLESPTALHDLSWETYSQLMNILGDEYPSENFFYPYAKLIFGKNLEKTELQLQTASISSSPSLESPSVR